MLIFSKFIVRKNERGLLFKNGDFLDFLEPGTYHYFDPLRKINLEVYDLSVPEFSHRLIDFFIKEYPEAFARYFSMIDLGAQQLALVHKNGQLSNILPPSTRTVYWKGVIDITTEIIDISDNFEIPSKLAGQLVPDQTDYRLPQKSREFINSQVVPEHQMGILYVNGQCTKTLSPGLHAYWQFNRNINIEIWDTRLQNLEVL